MNSPRVQTTKKTGPLAFELFLEQPTTIMLKLGTTPKLDFKVEALDAGKVIEKPFKDFLMGKPTVVSVYMRNNTSACDKQTKEIEKNQQVIAKQGFRIVTVSRDPITSHTKYAQKHGYDFTLIADPEDQFSKAMDAIVEKSMYGKKYFGPARAAYLFNSKGKLLVVIPKVEAATHGAQILEAIRSLP